VAVDERAFIKKLQKTIGYFLMCFLEFVEKQYGKRLSRDSLGDEPPACRRSVSGWISK